MVVAGVIKLWLPHLFDANKAAGQLFNDRFAKFKSRPGVRGWIADEKPFDHN